MGGIGFIETNKAVIVRDNTLINQHSIEAARVNGVSRFLYTSSACIYPGYLQKRRYRRGSSQGRGRVSRRRRRRLRMGEALHGADLPPLYRGLPGWRRASCVSTTSMDLWGPTTEGAKSRVYRDLPQGRAGEKREAPSKCGATASRRVLPIAISTIAWRASIA